MVENLWDCGWQEYAAQNDDAFDGIVIMKRGSNRPVATGGIVFTQVKCGSDGYKKLQIKNPDHIGVSLGEGYINAHVERWLRAPGPAVLIFVDDETSKRDPNAYWVNVKLDDAYSKTNKGLILIPKAQRFDHHTKGDFHKLCGSAPADSLLEEIRLNRNDCFIPSLGKANSLKEDAWKFYRNWANSGIPKNPTLGPILVNRTGWEHMTRNSRLPERVAQSWLLLGAAKRMIESCVNYWTLGNASSRQHADGSVEITDYLGLRAIVAFPFRHHSVVQVILKRSRLTRGTSKDLVRQKIWFYSVYELRRGRAPA